LHTLVLQGGAQALLLLFSMLLAQRFDLVAFGDFIFGFQVGQVGASILALGATFYLAKNFAAYSDIPEGMQSTFRLQNRFLARGSLVLLAAWVLFAFIERKWVSTAAFGVSIANFAIVMMTAYFVAVGKAPLGNLLQAGRSLVLCMGVLLSLGVITNAHPGSVVLIAACSYTLVVYLLAGCRYSFGVRKGESTDQYEFARQHIYFVVMTGIDILILKLMALPNDVAIYGVALFLSNAASFALYAINANFTARISRSVRSESRGESQKLLRSVAKLNALLSLPFLLVLIVFAMNLTLFYGEDFENSKFVFLILLAGQVINVFVGSVALVANVSGYESYISKFIFQSLLLKVFVGAAASYLYGASGMAIAASLSNALWNTRSFVFVLNNIGLNTTILRFQRIG